MSARKKKTVRAKASAKDERKRVIVDEQVFHNLLDRLELRCVEALQSLVSSKNGYPWNDVPTLENVIALIAMEAYYLRGQLKRGEAVSS